MEPEEQYRAIGESALKELALKTRLNQAVRGRSRLQLICKGGWVVSLFVFMWIALDARRDASYLPWALFAIFISQVFEFRYIHERFEGLVQLLDQKKILDEPI